MSLIQFSIAITAVIVRRLVILFTLVGLHKRTQLSDPIIQMLVEVKPKLLSTPVKIKKEELKNNNNCRD